MVGAVALVGLVLVLLRVFAADDDALATDPTGGDSSSVAPTGSTAPEPDAPDAPRGVGKRLDLADSATFEVPGTASPTTDFDGTLVAYEASQMADGNPATTWRIAGDATGQQVVITLAEPGVVNRVGLVNGYAKKVAGVDWYPNNRRILAVTWGFDDGTEVEQTFAERPAMQLLKVPPVETSTVTLTITSVTPPGSGSLGRDYTAISEVSRHRAASRLSTTAARSASARETSRWVTRRTARGPTAAIRTPSSAARATNDAASGRSTTTMLVSTRDGSRPSASPSRRACSWSSASRSTWWSRAYAPAAARTPTWRIPPPIRLRLTRARSIASARADHERADGCAEALGEADGEHVGDAAVVGQRRAGGDVGVPQPGAVEVDAGALGVGPGAQLAQVVDGEHRATGEVVGVLDRDRRRAHEERTHVGGVHRLDGGQVDLPARARPGAHRDAADRAVGTQLGARDVRRRLAQHLLAGRRRRSPPPARWPSSRSG